MTLPIVCVNGDLPSEPSSSPSSSHHQPNPQRGQKSIPIISTNSGIIQFIRLQNGFVVIIGSESLPKHFPQLGDLFGPTSTGLYYVKEPTWFSWRHIFLRYRFHSGRWEWCTSGDSTRETSWASIPARIPAHLAITPANATAICYLRDNSPRPHFARHIVEEAPLGRGAFGEVRRVKFGLIMGHDRFLPANCDVAMKTICILPNRNAQLQAVNQGAFE